ncbi:MAG: major capsid family protein [Candidatus Binatia bacterium]
MKQINHQELAKYGVFIPQAKGYLEPHELAMDYSLAMDAQPAMITTANGGIPAFLTTLVDPEIVRVLVTPNNAAKILGETKKGDWTTQTTMFPVIESTGEVSSYGDFNNNGSVGANANWVNRQSYLYQTITQWGELELDRAAEAKIGYAQELNLSSALIMDKFQNNSYFYGMAGLQCYGLLNDPSLPASIVPTTKAATGTTWAVATAAEIYDDVVKLYTQLVTQTKGLIDRKTAMVMALAPEIEAYLTKTNQYNVNVTDQIAKNFPNIRIETATQYNTSAGQLIQLFVENVDGKDTGYCAFNEKMRAHAVIPDVSSFKQKKTGGTWGAIIRYPVAFASMLGV